jgi:hypothetical protein
MFKIPMCIIIDKKANFRRNSSILSLKKLFYFSSSKL